MRNALTYAQTELNNKNLMKRYIISLNGLIKSNFPNYELNVKTGNNTGFAKPNSGNQTNLRLARKNKQANLILHRKGNGINIAWGLTQPAARGKRYGTQIRALAALAALRANIPMTQWSVFGKNSGSYKIMRRLGAIPNNNSQNHFKFVPGRHNLNQLKRRVA
jgi:hypothetical protein